jgi:hypothetical protein
MHNPHLTAVPPARPRRHTRALLVLVLLCASLAVASPPSAGATAIVPPAGPKVGAVTPDAGPLSGGQHVLVRGFGFRDVRLVTIGGQPVPYLVLSGTRLVAATPAVDAPGGVQVRVTAAGGRSPRSDGSRYSYVMRPRVDLVTPNAGPTAGGNKVTVTGRGLGRAERVTFAGTDAPFTVVSPRKITTTAPAGTDGGRLRVRVHSPGGRSTIHPLTRYRYLAPPTITDISPSSGFESGGETVVVTGTWLGSATRVTFGGVDATSFDVLSPTSVSAVAPPGTAGPAQIRVTTPGGRTAIDSISEYLYVEATPPPVITSLTPSSGPPAGGTQVIIDGSGFDDLVEVRFGLTPAFVFMATSDQLRVFAPAGAPGPVQVVVVTGAGESEQTSASEFTYVVPPTLPWVESVTPNQGPLAGGTAVTITGTDFTDVTDVTFGDNSALEFTVESPTEISATSPPGEFPNFMYHVRVHTTAGSSPMHSESEWSYN